MSSVDHIDEVRIDPDGRLIVCPRSARFPYVYREAMEVHWDSSGNFLYGPRPREWSYLDWFRHILKAASIQECTLLVDDSTRWSNVPDDLRAEMAAVSSR